MVGLFSFSSSLKNKSMTLGYRRLKHNDSSKGLKTSILKGHEFHYSTLVNNREKPIMTQKNPGKKPDVHDGYRHKNCLATYTHIYWGNSRAWLKYILRLIALQSDVKHQARKR
jgi:cobyrinic acid a,c-diamide synthase